MVQQRCLTTSNNFVNTHSLGNHLLSARASKRNQHHSRRLERTTTANHFLTKTREGKELALSVSKQNLTGVVGALCQWSVSPIPAGSVEKSAHLVI